MRHTFKELSPTKFNHQSLRRRRLNPTANIFLRNGPLSQWFKCSPIVLKTRVGSLVESYQRLPKWYLMPPCFSLSFIIYGSKVSRAILGKEWSSSLHLNVVAKEKGAFESSSTTVGQLKTRFDTMPEVWRYLIFCLLISLWTISPGRSANENVQAFGQLQYMLNNSLKI